MQKEKKAFSFVVSVLIFERNNVEVLIEAELLSKGDLNVNILSIKLNKYFASQTDLSFQSFILILHIIVYQKTNDHAFNRRNSQAF